MAFPVGLIAHAIRTSETPEEAAALLSRYATIREQIVLRDQEVQRIREDAEKRVKAIMAEVICTHEVVRDRNDPINWHERTDECLICGYEIPRREPRFT